MNSGDKNAITGVSFGFPENHTPSSSLETPIVYMIMLSCCCYDCGTFSHSARDLLCIFCESPANKMRRVANLIASVQTMKQLQLGKMFRLIGLQTLKVFLLVPPVMKTPIATMAGQHTMSELFQAPTEGYRDVIFILAILADNFELKITSTLKYHNVPNEAIKLMLFPFSIDEAAWIRLEKQPPHSILTWEVLVSKFVNQFFPPSNTTNLKNDITRFQQKFKETFSEAWDCFKDLLRKFPHHGFLKLHQIDTFYNALTQSDQDSLSAAAGGNLLNRTPRDALTIIKNKSKMVREILVMKKANQQAIMKAVEETCVTCGGPRSLPSNTIANSRGNLKAITIQSGVSYDRPTLPPTSSLPPKEVVREPKVTKDKVQPTSLESTAHIQPPVVQVPIQEVDVSLKPNPKPSIPYPSRLNDQTLCEKSNNQMLKFLQIFQRLHFDISFLDALLHMPKFAPTFNSLLSNKEKLFELENTPLNENYECLALSDLGASINLMPLSIWKRLSFSKHTSTRMTLELANRSTVIPTGVAEDVFVKVGKFYFLAHFVVVDYDVDPRVLLILERLFLMTVRALIDVYGEELTLQVNDEAITFKVRHTSRYSYNLEESVNRIDVIDVACEEYAQEVLGFLDNSNSGNPTPSLDPIITTSSSSFTPFKGDKEKAAYSKVLKSHKWAIAWKISDIKGIDSHFYTHKILMEDDFKLAVQHQSRENSKIHEVIKKEVIKLLDAGLIYLIFDSPWVSLVYCVLKKGGMTVAKNEDNELIPTRLVTRWRTRKTKRRLPSLALMGRFPTDVCLSAYVMLPARFKENLAADHLSRLENPNQGDLEKKEINETFLLETLGVISSYGDSSTPMRGHLSRSRLGCAKKKVATWNDLAFKIIIPRDMTEHDKHLELVLKTMQSQQLYEKTSAAMKDWSTLVNIKQLRGFLGLTCYYRTFIKNYTAIGRPLIALLKKNSFEWSKLAQKAFEELKSAMMNAPVLALLDF
nr:reverse transcriptase domain-containing protein [Tanacetum cinerariifolium]